MDAPTYPPAESRPSGPAASNRLCYASNPGFRSLWIEPWRLHISRSVQAGHNADPGKPAAGVTAAGRRRKALLRRQLQDPLHIAGERVRRLVQRIDRDLHPRWLSAASVDGGRRATARPAGRARTDQPKSGDGRTRGCASAGPAQARHEAGCTKKAGGTASGPAAGSGAGTRRTGPSNRTGASSRSGRHAVVALAARSRPTAGAAVVNAASAQPPLRGSSSARPAGESPLFLLYVGR